MSLSPMQEIFVFLEDEKEVEFYRLKRWGRPARGVLSKLKNLGYIEKIIKDKNTFYIITPKGEEYADSVLSVLKKSPKWDKKWRLVMFEIPEKNRALRDKLRRALSGLGLGILQSSVWVSPQDVQKQIEEIDKKLSLGFQMKYFEVASKPNLDQQIITKSWNNSLTDEELEKFVKDAKWALKAMGKGNGDTFNAKRLIFEYALILKKGPILPEEFMVQNEVRKNAHEVYLKLRHFVV